MLFVLKIYSEKLNWKSTSKLKGISWENFNYKQLTEPPQQTNRKSERRESDNYYNSNNIYYHPSTTDSSTDISYKVIASLHLTLIFLYLLNLLSISQILRAQASINASKILNLFVNICTNQESQKIPNEPGFCASSTRNSRRQSCSN